MNANNAQTHFQTSPIHPLRKISVRPFARFSRWLQDTAGCITTMLEHRTAIANEREHLRTLARYRRAQARLEPEAFQFDPHRDDIFARVDG